MGTPRKSKKMSDHARTGDGVPTTPKGNDSERAGPGPAARMSAAAPRPGGLPERRGAGDRRDLAAPTGLERRRGPGRRLSDFIRAAEEGEMTPEQFLFLRAIDEFKRANDTAYPAWTDVLEVVRLLGYRKTMPSELSIGGVEDWREPANGASNVRPKRGPDSAASREELRELRELGLMPDEDAEERDAA